jgi:predicted nuclease of predicted toxin-antitoxin system
MRLLFDQNLSHKLPHLLSDLFPGSTQVRLLDLGQADDRRIWDVAEAGGFAIVSLDADFAELAQLRGPPPKVIWLRCGNQPTRFVADLLRRQAAAVQDFGIDSETACLELY